MNPSLSLFIILPKKAQASISHPQKYYSSTNTSTSSNQKLYRIL